LLDPLPRPLSHSLFIKNGRGVFHADAANFS
jgi:hypothetical protein